MGDKSEKYVPYTERPDDAKLLANWKKARAQFKREDWSACVMRVATSTEIAANIHVRHYFIEEHHLPQSIVDALLESANGVAGKFGRLIAPIAKARGTWEEIKKIQTKVEAINRQRNSIAHSGHFKNKPDADSVFEDALMVIRILAPNASATLEIPKK